jgi:hypothetical protein
MMQVRNAITPFHEAASLFPEPGVKSAGYLY